MPLASLERIDVSFFASDTTSLKRIDVFFASVPSLVDFIQ
jgi:hypothetical protein